jgi:hypothetical protein
MAWYMTVEPCCVSVLCLGVRDPSRVEWSRRRCTSPSLGKVLISLTSRGHLTLVVTSCGLPHGARVLGY